MACCAACNLWWLSFACIYGGVTRCMLAAGSSALLSCCAIMAACAVLCLAVVDMHQLAADCAPSLDDHLCCPAAGGPCWQPWESSLARHPQACPGECTCLASAYLYSGKAFCSHALQT